MSTGVYQIVCRENGKKYIGSSFCSIERRFKAHLKMLQSGNHHAIHLQRCFDKYGEESLLFQVIEFTGKDKQTVEELEQQYINAVNACDLLLNSSTKVSGSSVGNRGALKGRKLSDERKAQMSEQMTGRKQGPYSPITEEHRRKLSEARKGKPKSEEMKRKLSESRLGKKFPRI